MSRKAYMIGMGIGNLAAAFYLIRDGQFDGHDITLFGIDDHGANDGMKTTSFMGEYEVKDIVNQAGYLARGGRMLNRATYENLWDLFSEVPSLDHPSQSVTDDIYQFDDAHPTHDVGRLMDYENGVRNKDNADNYYHMQFNNKDRYLLTKLMMMSEKDEDKLNNVSIEEWFADSPHIFETNFWYMWETTFAFKRNNSAMELRRYMNRMLLEFTRINTLEGVTRTPYNQFESLILPLRHYLEEKGVQFVNHVVVESLDFRDTPWRDEICVTAIHYEDFRTHEKHVISVEPNDLVFDTNGSITDSATLGDFHHPAVENPDIGPSARLWKQIASHFYSVGHPDKFFNHRDQSEWMSFTVTCNNHFLVNKIAEITQQQPGNALNTFVDSTPLLSLVVHHQPHFHTQKENETVFWGYFLYPREEGNFVHKKACDMTGEDILYEVLGNLSMVDKSEDNILNHVDEIMDSIENVVPVWMPYASAEFNVRAKGDRPKVVPDNSINLAFISQFCEMPFDMVFTEQYAIRAAQMAVYQLLGIPLEKMTPVHHYEKDPRILLKAAKTMFR